MKSSETGIVSKWNHIRVLVTDFQEEKEKPIFTYDPDCVEYSHPLLDKGYSGEGALVRSSL